MSAATVATAPTAPSKFDAAILEWITSAKTISAFDKIDVLSACADGMSMKDNIYNGDANNAAAAAATTPSRHTATRRAAAPTPAETKREVFAALKAEIEGRIGTFEKEGQEAYEREQRGAATSDDSVAKATLSDGDDEVEGEIVAETEATEDTKQAVASAPEGEEAEPVVETAEETDNNAEVVAAPSDAEEETHNATVGSSSGVPAADDEKEAVPQEEDTSEPTAEETKEEEPATASGEPTPATEDVVENETETTPKESEEVVINNNATIGSSGVPATADEEKEEAADLPETAQHEEVVAETTEAPSADATAEEPVSALAEEY